MPTDLSRRSGYYLREKFEINPPTGPTLFGTLWQTSRRTGRRIQVHDADGAELFDTDDCYDQGNATNRLDLWLAERFNLKPVSQEAK
jgi:hypothetical protein